MEDAEMQEYREGTDESEYIDRDVVQIRIENTDDETRNQVEVQYNLMMSAVLLEHKFVPHLNLPNSTKDGTEISLRMRNGSAHVLRCLKVWYDLPSRIFFNGINIMDRFLSRMRAQPKHLSCIAVSAFHIACKYSKLSTADGVKVPKEEDLTNISQAKCTSGDVQRMEKIIVEKLETNFNSTEPITAHYMLEIFYTAHSYLAAIYLSSFPTDTHPPFTSLEHKLEIIACDAAYTQFRASEIALALLDVGTAKNSHQEVHQAILFFFQQACKVAKGRRAKCRQVVSELICQYESQQTSPHRQRLVWKLSYRTMRVLRPTQKLKSKLPTIVEAHQPHPIIKARLGSVDSEEVSEEEMEFDYDQEFPPLPPPSMSLRSPLKINSSHKNKNTGGFPYPKTPRKHGRMA